eukprot:gnl/TRDRNA2_/TRDRNA2_27608_c1_seq1.p1 gnl/TRDRNA2_/TRDRNA2_27608_c1~~gnl/TRDRNA2_/TRDRNA2_27608_c1_seq1.p1  ORF type:complete len:436 (+),score=121.55 gnl/TRDRNA2_/TRDRNA2_27608_c1_seq1:133-1308(+)
MFGFAKTDASKHKLTDIIDAAVAEVLVGDLDEAKLSEARRLAKERVGAITNIEKLNLKRVAKKTFGNATFPVEVNTFTEEFDAAAMAVIKQRALTKKDATGNLLLTPLFCEVDLLGDTIAYAGNIDPKLIEKANNARKTANDLLDNLSQKKGVLVTAFWESKLDILKQLDSSIIVEAAFFKHMAQEGGRALLRDRVLAVLPQKDSDECNPKVCLMKLLALKGTVFYEYVSDETQYLLNVACQMVTAITQDRLPQVSGKAGDFSSEVAECLERFCRKNVSAGASESAVCLVGRPALEHMWDDVKKKYDAKQQLDPDDLRVFHTFNWMLTGAQQELHNEMVASIVKMVGKKGAVISAKPAGPKDPPTMPDAKSVEHSKAEALVLKKAQSLFKN